MSDKTIDSAKILARLVENYYSTNGEADTICWLYQVAQVNADEMLELTGFAPKRINQVLIENGYDGYAEFEQKPVKKSR